MRNPDGSTIQADSAGNVINSTDATDLGYTGGSGPSGGVLMAQNDVKSEYATGGTIGDLLEYLRNSK
jgi:hypothetical protein